MMVYFCSRRGCSEQSQSYATPTLLSDVTCSYHLKVDGWIMPPKQLRAAKIPPHVGYDHRIYSIRSGDGSDIKYSMFLKEGCKLEAYIEIHLRDDNSLNAQQDFIAPVSVELERVMQRVIEIYDMYQNKSHDQSVSKLLIVECFYLELLPDSFFSNTLVTL